MVRKLIKRKGFNTIYRVGCQTLQVLVCVCTSILSLLSFFLRKKESKDKIKKLIWGFQAL